MFRENACVYPRLKAEMIRQGVNYQDLAAETDIEYKRLLRRLTHGHGLLLEEAILIWRALNFPCLLSDLFAQGDDGAA